MRKWLLACACCVAVLATAAQRAQAQAAAVPEKVREAQKKRIEVINKVKSAVVAVMARDPKGNLVGNGSGVLISEDGYALTNWHVTNAAGSPILKCGLPDGKTYDAVLVGLDKVGDVALIKLFPKNEGDKFPFVVMGNSDSVQAGDWCLAMGNPFSLATDFTPTVTYGMVSGVHRYQYPAGTLLEYTDCIQVDTSINPGNSGGPLFNMNGELIGINGRISLEKRGRVNVGVGYAISINQIKNFLGHLLAGLDSDHSSLGAAMESENEDTISRILVRSVIDSDAMRRGLDVGDQLIMFGGRGMTTVNQYKNVLGLFPKGWRVPLVYRRAEEGNKTATIRAEIIVRLMGVQRQALDGGGPPPKDKQPPGPGPGPQPNPGKMAKYYKNKEGFANYYFNEQAQKAVMDRLVKESDLTAKTGDWKISFKGKRYTKAGAEREMQGASWVEILDKGAKDTKSPKIKCELDGVDYSCEPLTQEEKAEKLKDPPETGGFMVAMYQYRQLLAHGAKGFGKDFEHGGWEPFYPAVAGEGKTDYTVAWRQMMTTRDNKDTKVGKEAKRDVKDAQKLVTMTEVLRTKHAGVPAKWYFALEDDPHKRWSKGQLIGFEVTVDRDDDPCEVCLSEYRDVGGHRLPSRVHVRYKGRRYGDFVLSGADLK